MSTSSSDPYPPLPILGWSSVAKWHLLRRKVKPEDEKNFSESHRFRIISHEEFRILSRYLDVYKDLGKIIVEDSLSTVILHRLTGFDIEQSGWRYLGRYSYDTIPNPLGENDHVLVAYGTVDGMYVHISYTQADRARFQSMVVTGVIEPKKIAGYPPISKLIVIAEKVARNQQRIVEAQRLLKEKNSVETDKEESRNGLSQLISAFTQENDSLIAIDNITPRMVDDAIASTQKELEFLEQEQNKIRLLLQIDSAVERDINNNGHYSSHCISEDRKVQQGRADAIQKNLAKHKEILRDLKALRTYIMTTP